MLHETKSNYKHAFNRVKMLSAFSLLYNLKVHIIVLALTHQRDLIIVAYAPWQGVKIEGEIEGEIAVEKSC